MAIKMVDAILVITVPSWSRGKAPRSGGVGLNPLLKDGGLPNDIGSYTTSGPRPRDPVPNLKSDSDMALVGIKVIEVSVIH